MAFDGCIRFMVSGARCQNVRIRDRGIGPECMPRKSPCASAAGRIVLSASLLAQSNSKRDGVDNDRRFLLAACRVVLVGHDLPRADHEVTNARDLRARPPRMYMAAKRTDCR